MSQPNIAEWLQAGAAVVAAIAAVFVLWQLVLTKRQIQLAAKEIDFNSNWNSMNATFTYFTNDDFLERERAAVIKLSPLGINLYQQKQPLSDDIVKKIYADPTIHCEVKDFLNVFEGYATAVNAGAFQYECAYLLMSRVFSRYMTVFKPYVVFVRAPEQMNSDGLWIEMEKVAAKWKQRADSEDAALEAERLKKKGMNQVPGIKSA